MTKIIINFRRTKYNNSNNNNKLIITKIKNFLRPVANRIKLEDKFLMIVARILIGRRKIILITQIVENLVTIRKKSIFFFEKIMGYK